MSKYLPVLQHHCNDDLMDLIYRVSEIGVIEGTGEPMHHSHVGGHCTDVEKVREIIKPRLTNLVSRTAAKGAETEELWQVQGGGFLCFSANKGKGDSWWTVVNFVHPNRSFVEELMLSLKPLLSKRPTSSNIMMMAQGPHGGLELSSIGVVNNPLLPDNYSEKTLEAYKHVKACLSTNSPCGRFVLLSGPPGTGKSYLIRAITSEVKALFVLVPANLANQLTGPTILPLLSNYKNDETPIVLIIEDADMCITQDARSTNPGGLSDILNLGDGLFGELADIRILVTSNADKMELDPAIIRPGRMCKHLAIDYLTPEEARAAYKRITDKEADWWKASDSKITLAEVYRRARTDGWVPEKPEQKEIGFYV